MSLSQAQAESTATVPPVGTTQEAVNVPSPSGITGFVELRPSWTTSNNEFHTENTLNLGYRISPDVSVDFEQYFNTNLDDPTGQVTGVGLIGTGGFLRARFRNVWTNVSRDLSFNYEGRIYLPTDDAWSNAGVVTAMRNYFGLSYTAAPGVTLTIQEVPIVFASSRAGTGTDANPAFENRVYLIGSFDITDNLNFTVPVMVHATLSRNYAPAGDASGAWGFTVWTWPELTFAVADKTSVGLSYYSGNLIQSDFTDTNFFGPDGGFTKGIAQVVFHQDI